MQKGETEKGREPVQGRLMSKFLESPQLTSGHRVERTLNSWEFLPKGNLSSTSHPPLAQGCPWKALIPWTSDLLLEQGRVANAVNKMLFLELWLLRPRIASTTSTLQDCPDEGKGSGSPWKWSKCKETWSEEDHS